MEYEFNYDELMHYKYISRKKVNGKWQYVYDQPAGGRKSLPVQNNTQVLPRANKEKKELVSGPRQVTTTTKLKNTKLAGKTTQKKAKTLSIEEKTAKRVKLGKDVLKKYGLG